MLTEFMQGLDTNASVVLLEYDVKITGNEELRLETLNQMAQSSEWALHLNRLRWSNFATVEIMYARNTLMGLCKVHSCLGCRSDSLFL